MENPASDPEFHVTAAEMLRCGSSNVAGGVTIGDIFGVIGGVVGTVINYFRDLFIPYTPPTTCAGPIVTGSCDEDDILCQGNIADMAKKVGNIPGVSTGFKKCMKGRFGCGGSTFPKLRIACASSSNCGPCGSGAGGCNYYGSTMWYCSTQTTDRCWCANVIFHEAAHACGAVHSLNYYLGNGCSPGDPACDVGIWFKKELEDTFAEVNQCCIPCSGQLDGPTGGSDAD